MFSRRTPASLAANRLSAALDKRRRAGLPILDLTKTNPTQCGLELPGGEILAALQEARALAYEPAPQGWLGAREAIASWHARHGASLDPARLFLTASTSEAYSWCFKLLSEPGDHILVPRPSYPLFECLAALDGVGIRPYPLLPGLNWAIDRSALEAALSPRTRAIVLVNPNNPTGSYVHHEDWLYLTQTAAARRLALISDEVFFDYILPPATPRLSALSLPAEALTFTLSGLSKIAALPQMKLGWIHVGGPPALVREACARLEWIADAYLPVSAPVLYAAPAWLRLADRIQQTILDRCRASLAAFQAELHGEVQVLPPEAGWAALVQGPRTVDGEELALRLLERHGILVQPGYFYDLPPDGYLALSLLTPPGAARPAAAWIREIWSSASDFPPASR
jgi:aspartate/methionine/tyrosine aminotransferase